MSRKPRCCQGQKLNPTMAFVSAVSSVLSDGNRLRILCLLRNGERCVCDIWQALDLPQNLVSHHLKALRDAKLITSRKDGLKVIYAVNRQAFVRFSDKLEKIIGQLN